MSRCSFLWRVSNAGLARTQMRCPILLLNIDELDKRDDARRIFATQDRNSIPFIPSIHVQNQEASIHLHRRFEAGRRFIGRPVNSRKM